MGFKTEIWALGVVRGDVSAFLTEDLPRDIVWIEPPRDFTFLADPHGIWRDGKLYVFAEFLDYRVKTGEIVCYVLDAALNVIEQFPVMREKTHLSYPFILEDAGEIYMIPENSRSGQAWIYRAVDFPKKWEKVSQVLPDTPMIDASFIPYDGMWWVFYALPGEGRRAEREMYAAYAPQLLGPWTRVQNEPIITGLAQARVGGRPFVVDGTVHIPVQDCTQSYGGALRVMVADVLTPAQISLREVRKIDPVFHAKYKDGIHTLSGCKDVTLIDCKWINPSKRRRFINYQRRLRRLSKR